LQRQQRYKKVKDEEWYKERRRKERIKQTEWRKNYNKKYWEENKDKLNEKNKNYNKIWYRENKKEYQQKKKIYERKRRVEDEDFRIRKLLRRRVWEAFQLYSKNGKEKKSDEYGIDYPAIVDKLIKELPKDYHKVKYEIDHKIPLCSFDLTDPEQVKKAFSVDNHQWLSEEAHLKKSLKDRNKSLTKNTKV